MVLKAVFRKDVGTKIKTILQELKPLSDDPDIRRLIRLVWLYLVSSATHMKQDYGVLHNTIKKVVEVESMPTMLEIWKAEGKAESVLTFLRARFKKVPTSIENSVRQMTDSTALDTWAAEAATCQSLEEFETALNQ